MLSDAPVMAILPTTDVDRAKDFYQNTLGLKLAPEPIEEGGAMFEAGKGTRLLVYTRQEPNKAEHTQAGFMVDDLEGVIKELEDKGVKFEDYDLENVKTVGHIMTMDDGTRTAWFKDPDGNILAINATAE